MPTFKLKDLDIIKELDKFGAQIPATRISNNLNIPARTIRYRLAKLKENKLLIPSFVFMNERRLGLGEEILILEENMRALPMILSIFNSFSNFYWHARTYGKYNGILVHSVFDLSKPDSNLKIITKLKKSNLIKDYKIIPMIDYHHKSMDFTKYRPKLGWDMNWNDLFKKISNRFVCIRKISLNQLLFFQLFFRIVILLPFGFYEFN